MTRWRPFLLLPSVFTGPVVWRAVAERLRAVGHEVVVADPGRPRDPADALAAYAAAGRGRGALVLVPHSNAGLYAPRMAEAMEVVSTVFVDAALPGDGPETALVPAALAERLRPLADRDGRLPSWTRWWDPADLEGLFPDDAARDAVVSAEPRIPVAYLEARLPVPTGWANGPSAYLAFGDTYAAETAIAREHGWPTTVMPGRHLHLLHAPATVAAEIVRLAEWAASVTGPTP